MNVSRTGHVVGKLCASRLLAVVLTATAVIGCQGLLARTASAQTEGEAIVAAAQVIASQSYPAQPFSTAKYVYCWDGGTATSATPGSNDPTGGETPKGGAYYSNCNSIGRTGFDCRGLVLYALYQGTDHAVTLPTGTAEEQYSRAASYGGADISASAVQPGDLVFFGYKANEIKHVGIAVSGTGTSAHIISAISEGYGISTTDVFTGDATTVHWFEHQYKWVGAVAIPGVGDTVGGGGGGSGLPDPAQPMPGDFDGGPTSDVLFQDPGSSTWDLVAGGGADNSAAGLYQFVTGWEQPAWELSGDFLGNSSDQVLFQDAGSSTWDLVAGGGADNSAAGLYQFFVTGWEKPAWELSGDFLGNGSDQVLFQDAGSSTWDLLTGGGADNSAAGLYQFVTG